MRSILVERGKEVVTRRHDVAKLMRDGTLDPESNMNFGEGGAGAYTDGKLSTRINHPMVRKVIETFARLGAPDRILVAGQAAHRLGPAPRRGGPAARGAGRRRLRGPLRHPGGGLWCTRTGGSAGVRLVGRDGSLESDRVILVPGNSARELFERFAQDGRVMVEAKPFALGFRVEHPQALIDEIQYGEAAASPKLPPADYKLAENLAVRRRVARHLLLLHVPGRHRGAHPHRGGPAGAPTA